MSTNLPPNWQIVKLKDIATTTSGGTPSRKNKSYFNGNIPWLKSGELNDSLVKEISENISQEALSNSSAKLFPKGTVLMAMYGATIGKLGILDLDATTNQAICAIFPKDTKSIHNKYLFRYLQLKRTELISKAIGGAQPNINQGIIRSLDFPLAPYLEQQKIVNKIEELFSVVDEQSKQVATMKKQANLIRQALLQAAVTGKLIPFPSVKKSPLKELGQWTGGGTPSKSVKEYWSSGNIPWVSPKDMKSRFISDTQDKISKKAVENSSAKLIKTGSLLIVTRSGILRRTLPVAVTKVEATVNQDIKALTPNENTILGEYLLILFEAFNNEIRHKCSKSGTTVESIEYPTLLKYEVEYPGIDEQKQVIQLINEFESVLLSEEKALTETKQLANQLKQSILKQAFEGKLV